MAEPSLMTDANAAPSPFFDEVLLQLQRRMRKEQFDTWFRGFHLVQVGQDEAEFSVPSGFVRDWLTRNYLSTIQESVIAAGEGVRRVRLSLRELPPDREGGTGGPSGRTVERVVEDVAAKMEPVPAAGPAPPRARPAPSKALDQEHPLNPHYTFEHFVVGPSNRLAHAASFAIGENPGCSYNPLFVHGHVGLGKTHLLQAVCHGIRRRDHAARVLYLSCEDFTNRFIHSIQNGHLDEFRSFYRNADVLVIDDVQFLAGKDKTQEEFFHTFNALYHQQKQIIISSDRSPHEIPTIEERLVSRFKWGLVTEIEVPDFETRVAIVKRKARLRSKDAELPDEVAYMIAERIANNIRELEGAVIKVIGIAAILGRTITPELAEEALRGVAAARNAHITLDQIMNVITSEFSLSARDITGKSRTQAISLPRQIGMFLSRKYTEHSLEEIGRYFGNRDHTTVLYSVNRIETRISVDRMLKDLLDNLGTRLQSGR